MQRKQANATAVIAILAVGQMLLGNPLAAVGQIITGVTLTNPIAITCAAIGAICYGWSALTEEERASVLDRLAAGLAMGVELILSLIDFVIRTTGELLSSKQLADFKDYVRTQAALFGKSLFDVTGKLGDLVKGAAQMTSSLTGQLVDVTTAAAKDAYEAVAAGASNAGRATAEAAERAAGAASRAADATALATRRALGIEDTVHERSPSEPHCEPSAPTHTVTIDQKACRADETGGT